MPLTQPTPRHPNTLAPSPIGDEVGYSLFPPSQSKEQDIVCITPYDPSAPHPTKGKEDCFPFLLFSFSSIHLYFLLERSSFN